MLKNWLIIIVKVTWLLSLRDSVMGWGVGDGGDGLPYADVGVACGLPPPE